MLKLGDLVKTDDGYYAIVMFVEDNEVGVFLGNGMATIYEQKQLEHCPGNVEVSNFEELLKRFWSLYDQRPPLIPQR